MSLFLTRVVKDITGSKKISQSSAFSLIEMIFVLIIVGVMMVMVKSLINTNTQQRKIYGEGCFNYLVSQVQLVKTNVDYGRFTGMNIAAGVVPERATFLMTGFLNAARTSGRGMMRAGGFNGAQVTSYFSLPFSTSTTTLPAQCAHKSFTMVLSNSLSTSSGISIEIPTIAYTGGSAERYIGTGQGLTGINSQASFVQTFTACDRVSNSFAATPPSVGVVNCVDIGRLHFDRRAKTIHSLKCAGYAAGGVCATWATL